MIRRGLCCRRRNKERMSLTTGQRGVICGGALLTVIVRTDNFQSIKAAPVVQKTGDERHKERAEVSERMAAVADERCTDKGAKREQMERTKNNFVDNIRRFPRLGFGWRQTWILENVQKDGTKFVEDDCRNRKVPFQMVNLVSHFVRQICHVRPLLHLGKELNQTVDFIHHFNLNRDHPMMEQMEKG